MMPAEAREVTGRAIVQAARADSSIFTDAFFGYTSAPFQRAWHRAWNRPGARVVQWSPVEHGKTQQVTGAVLHRLGSDPVNARILWISGKQTSVTKSTGILKQAIEEPSPFLRAAFPTLRPGRQKWTQAQFTVAGAKVTEKDCSVEAAGVQSEILGGRFTDIILDDICTFQTTFTAAQRVTVTKWFFSTVIGRLLPGGRIICLGNAWYPDDVMHAMAERGYTMIREEAYHETEDGKIVPASILWPEQWPLKRLEERRKELGGPGSAEADRQLRCKPYSAGQGRFQLTWFEKAMEAGRGLTLLGPGEIYAGQWGPAFLGVDLGVSQKEGADPTAFWCMGVDPKTSRRVLLDTFEERIDGPTVIAHLKAWNRRFAPSTRVENNAAQDFIRQWAREDGIATTPHTTGKNKADPAFGVPSLGVELSQGLWVLPGGDERSAQAAIRWRTQCLAYAPGQHTGDTLMASWFAREQARLGAGSSSVAVPPPDRPSAQRYGMRRGMGGFGISRRRG